MGDCYSFCDKNRYPTSKEGWLYLEKQIDYPQKYRMPKIALPKK